MVSTSHTGRIAGHFRTSTVFVGGGNGVGGGDASDVSSSTRLARIIQQDFQLSL